MRSHLMEKSDSCFIATEPFCCFLMFISNRGSTFYVVKKTLNISKINRLSVLLQFTLITVRDKVGDNVGNGKIQKSYEKKRESLAPLALHLSSIRFGFFFHIVHSPPSHRLEQASKTLKNKSSSHCAFMFHGCILPGI